MNARELAELLGLPAPTAEQEAVITGPLGPAAVVAGAGSGKTETMVSRVVWLVANGHLQAERVLGLTFTTKAAAELGGRLRTRLGQLRGRLGEPLAGGEPTVLTYHAYAARLVGEHALRLAVEPSARLLTPAATWQVAERVVREYDGDLPSIELSAPFVVSAVLDLAGELAEHLMQPDGLRSWTERFIAQIETPPRQRGSGPYAEVAKVLDKARGRLELLPLVERYQQAKRAAGAMDFGDQLAIAARVAQSAPDVGRIERSRYDAVLLDEYQDTSHAQLVLLQSLFGDGYPVTAVGDPCQSIYGWRGASAGNLTRFGTHFPPAATLPLTTSFRNGARVLDVANRISGPLRADVGILTPGPNCGPAAVHAALLPTVDDEAEWLAGQIERAWAREPRPSIAVLARRRASFSRIDRALRSRGIPVELVGLGGLLATPEVRDVVSTLQILSDPAAGSALIRLLTGARWRIGPRDLAALGLRARQLARIKREERDDAPPEPMVADPVEDASIVEALDDLGDPGRYSAEGFARMDRLRRELRDLRLRTGAALPELVADIERTLGLDVEVVAAGGSRAHLDRFLDVTAAFAEDAEVATLGSFIAYLAAAEAQERGLEAGEIEVAGDRVQILTVHASKGLEWDVVAVPSLTVGVFPDRDAASGGGWTRAIGALPYALRGDAGDLPVFDPAGADDQKELQERLKAFNEEIKERGKREERRLAYVAVTRARNLLLCSGYWWDDAVRPRGPAEFLEEIVDVPGVEVEHWAEPPEADAENPLSDVDRSVPWPVDPLGSARESVESGAQLVQAALAAGADSGQAELFDAEALEWEDDVTMLLAERARPRRSVIDVPMPEQLSVSALVTLRRDPAQLARRIRRPMPAEPAPLARRGTAFHAWLEARFGGERLLDIDELPGAADDGAVAGDELEPLQEAFLRSEWAARTPIEVEVPFEARVGELLVRGRMDAVFADDDGGFTVVDWKTGRQPGGAELRAATVQLAAYRLAWAQLRHVPVESVRAAFHYVRTGHTVAPADLMDADALAGLVEQIAVADS
ncbi:MAG TPA: UvrD-helicase domain-containing protein [Mycobacteriales bacterium]|nr:UvrD-helicase domain-containing protein [Mycobacteriales bacterium]